MLDLPATNDIFTSFKSDRMEYIMPKHTHEPLLPFYISNFVLYKAGIVISPTYTNLIIGASEPLACHTFEIDEFEDLDINVPLNYKKEVTIKATIRSISKHIPKPFVD